jgi:Uma2 family endonuclease
MATNLKDPPRRYHTLDEYFALERAGDARYEYWDGDIVCMSGGTRAHGLISGNVFYRLRQRSEGGPCRAFTADTAVLTPTLPPYRYPDASVACGELQFKNVRGVDALTNPVLIVEVLSPATAARDHEEKFAAYQAIHTFAEYLLVAQDEPRVTHYVKGPAGQWEREDVEGLEAVVSLPDVGCALPLREIYEGVDTLRPA